MPRFNLRLKLLFFTLLIAIVPLLIAGRTRIRIAQDELKSAANERLTTTAARLTEAINARHDQSWLAPLLLIRHALDDERLDVDSKISLLRQGLASIPDLVTFQITIEHAELPLVVMKERFAQWLQDSGLDPLPILRVPPEQIQALSAAGDVVSSSTEHIAATDDWLATVVLPLQSELGGAAATLSARIDLQGLQQMIEDDPFSRIGEITIVDRRGFEVLGERRNDLNDLPLVAEALQLLESGQSVITTTPHLRPDGERMLASVAFPRAFQWVVLVELNERDAYLAVDKMIRSLGLWVGIGMLIAIAAAILFALRLSRPILAIGRAAIEVSKGDFQTRVTGVRSQDEIGELATRINEMIVQLNERFQLQKFVSGGTMAAVQQADHLGVRLGGERRRVAMLFCDIRGYTAFSERTDPEQVVEILNFYLQHQADLVAAHGGDIDKFVGDEIVAVFQGEAMVADAVACALDIQAVMARLVAERPEVALSVGIGINVGEVVMGAMGSRQRMDFTVLGDNVNLTARLCDHASPGQILVSESAYQEVAGQDAFRCEPLAPLAVKGKAKPLLVYQVTPASSGETGEQDGSG
jgi:adenylate cyclase